jgi:hypothetical protein
MEALLPAVLFCAPAVAPGTAKVTGPADRRFALPSYLPAQTIPTVFPAVY